jgi:diguanylate cyclase (GGDEF)-like protein
MLAAIGSSFFPWKRSIRWKLAVSFIAVACFVAAFVGFAITMNFYSVVRAAQLEAAHVAELIANAAIENNRVRPDLQEYVVQLHLLRTRDVVIVDAAKKGLADAIPAEIGKTFDHDLGNEVGKTIVDGKTRTFVEISDAYPDGAYQIVVPLRYREPDKLAAGAVILEYTAIREELLAAELKGLYLVPAVGIVVVLLAAFFGLSIAKRITQPLLDLKSSVERIAAQDYGTRVAINAHDEIGLLGSAFNKMAEDLSVAAERAEYLAYYDPLTGLANRRLFLERVAQYMRSAINGGHKLAVFILDLERFKNINDSLGRPAGDALLKQVSAFLSRDGGDPSLLAHLGADHFAVVVPELKQEGNIASLLERKMRAFLDHTFRLNDTELRIAIKVGGALFPDDGTDADTLLRNAEAALKKAKASGERYLFYTQRMTATVAGNLTLENQLRQALDKGEFVLHYQPKVNLRSGKLTSAEALIRWKDPRTGLVPPGRFIPILEETGLIYEVGRWALRKAVEDYLRWRVMGLTAVPVAVNVSPLQLRDRGFIAEIKEVVGINAKAAAGLELEITESLIMEDIKHNIASLQAIRDMGVSIAIDDFGTGFSSLSYLSKLPVDTLKIDRSFVTDMTGGPEGLALVSTIINLAHSLKLKVVAEGVETEEQSRLLRLLNCDEMQGYLFSKPVPIEDFETKFLTPLPTGLDQAIPA